MTNMKQFAIGKKGKLIKYRGIPTNPEKKNEDKAKTITNRLGHLSISLPRIDDKKRWAGFPALAGWAKPLSDIIVEEFKRDTNLQRFVEPFSGTAKVYQELRKRNDIIINTCILNDTSKFVCDWLERTINTEGKCIITNDDFVNCINENNYDDTFLLIDFPWNKSFYDQTFSSFNRVSITQYSHEVLGLCESFKGKFIITSRRENKILANSEFNHKIIKSIYSLSGHYPKLLLTSNIDFEVKK
jgi:hypothetical protein